MPPLDWAPGAVHQGVRGDASNPTVIGVLVRLAGSSAVVTGGASGLGEATVRRLAATGAHVVVADLDADHAASLVADLGGAATFARTDVRSEADVAAALDAAQAAGPLRVAVTCAGVATPGRVVGRNGPMPLETYRSVIEVNLIGTFNLLRLAAERMGSNDPDGDDPGTGDRGVVVMTASIAAFDGQVGQAAYASSKGGVVGLTLTAARDLADRAIRVVTIAPGTFETPMLAGMPEQERQALAAQVPHPSRLGRPTEFAALVEHIVANPMLNGEVIRLDGALRMPAR
jgi:NAD(P)-dependent dehydrogenase (short-subunit alcohol dehydrogenase family)